MYLSAKDAFRYAREPFERYIDEDFGRIHQVLRLSIQGIGSTVGMVDLVEALYEGGGYSPQILWLASG